ncbi:MAG: hypothetical protein IT445_18845 [Phycisphaeraceae bacterium]|nr:hypothetical protein [Phycisphaeraceae bacterium]
MFLIQAMQLVILLALVAVGIWTYKRFHLPSAIWLVAYLLLPYILGLPTAHLLAAAVDGMASRGISSASFFQSIGAATGMLGDLATLLIVWLILGEIVAAYHKASPDISVPRVLLIPKRHPHLVGMALILCVTLLPIICLSCWVAYA